MKFSQESESAGFTKIILSKMYRDNHLNTSTVKITNRNLKYCARSHCLLKLW